ncbi:MAG TPA: sigma-E processing peptidase SpoIIGA [Candidatus Lachnoclostridium stercorigallinarum]|uniref:Sigma-E processing peptidase SpoIIGA n=1 Tax=Candidatus Lachnoclostridium stercorigallinarum TaxID=2838634 RepID=A0A9D2GHX8_9FIRM|nr:sigma-E processing peptidase SpoIIGA [Candidatus Lachnoclostridium stercorigallinarum]
MMGTVYIDVLFLINLSMDFLVLLLVRTCLRRYGPLWRLLLAAAAGALWACLTLVWAAAGPEGMTLFLYRGMAGLPGAVCTAAVMAWIAFGRGPGREFQTSLKRLIQDTAGIFLAAALLSGVWEGLGGLLMSGGGDGGVPGGDSLSLAAFLFLGAGAFFAGRFLWLTAAESARKRKYLCHVRLFYRGRKTETEALLDTGNRLFSPDGKRPVHVLEYGVCREICEKVDRVCYIPYRSVGRQDGVIPGITMDYMEIVRGEEQTRVEHPLVGIVRQQLSPDGSYRMLLNEKSEN